MPIIEPCIRPPAEAMSFLLQVTTGCSANTCTFCGAYRGKSFTVKPSAEVVSDIEYAAKLYPSTRKVFLMDGDALVLSNAKLVPVLRKLQQAFPHLSRISCYANGGNIEAKTDAELVQLYENKLRLLYIGLESGDQAILDRCRKKSSVAGMVDGVSRAARTGIRSSVIVLLGLGGRSGSEEHVKATAEALNAMQPRFVSFLSLMLIPGTALHQEARQGAFDPLSPRELLQESHDIISLLELQQTIFRCNHASNYVPLEGRLPQDKEYLLNTLKAAIDGRIGLKPELFRGL